MRATVGESEDGSASFAPDDEVRFEKGCGAQCAFAQAVAFESGIPEAKQHTAAGGLGRWRLSFVHGKQSYRNIAAARGQRIRAALIDAQRRTVCRRLLFDGT